MLTSLVINHLAGGFFGKKSFRIRILWYIFSVYFTNRPVDWGCYITKYVHLALLAEELVKIQACFGISEVKSNC